MFDLSSNVVEQNTVYNKCVNLFSQETSQFLGGYSGDRTQRGQTFPFNFTGF